MQDAPSSSPLPQDVSGCHALIAELSTALDKSLSKRETLAQEVEELHLTIQKLLSRLLGHRRERFEADPAQQPLNFGDDAAVEEGLADAAVEQAETYEEVLIRRRTKPRKVRSEQLPEHLERYEVVAPTTPDQEECAEHGKKQLIGYDITETLEFERPKLRVRQTKYPKFACAGHAECGIAQPPRPERTLVEGNRYDASIAAEIVTAKYAFHLPIYRQQDWFGGSGWMPDRSTLLNILASAAYVLEPLYQYYAEWVRMSQVISTDETRVMLLLPPEIPAAGEDQKCKRTPPPALARRVGWEGMEGRTSIPFGWRWRDGWAVGRSEAGVVAAAVQRV